MSNKSSIDDLIDWMNKNQYFVGNDLLYELEKIKLIHKQEIKDAIKNELKLVGNYFDVGKLEQREVGHHIRFTLILKDRFDYYNETLIK